MSSSHKCGASGRDQDVQRAQGLESDEPTHETHANIGSNVRTSSQIAPERKITLAYSAQIHQISVLCEVWDGNKASIWPEKAILMYFLIQNDINLYIFAQNYRKYERKCSEIASKS